MGSGESNEIEEIQPSLQGFHILHVQDKSPGQKAGLDPYFDFVIAANGVRLDEENDALLKILESHIKTEVPLHVYSIKTRELRVVNVIPDTEWGGKGLLGVSIRHCSFGTLDENIWHVRNVMSGSPAEHAGLVPESDYIVAADAALDSPGDIYAYIDANNLNTIRLYVYNCHTDQTRMVFLTPNADWGGPGVIGCELCYGLLHRIPERKRKPEEAVVVQDNGRGDKFSSVFGGENSVSVEGMEQSQSIENPTNTQPNNIQPSPPPPQYTDQPTIISFSAPTDQPNQHPYPAPVPPQFFNPHVYYDPTKPN